MAAPPPYDEPIPPYSRSMLDIAGAGPTSPRRARQTPQSVPTPQGSTSWPPGARNIYIDGEFICLDASPPVRLYKISNILDGRHPLIGLQLILRHTLSNDGVGYTPTLKRHVYNIKTSSIAGLTTHDVLGMHRNSFKNLVFAIGLSLTGRTWTIRSDSKTIFKGSTQLLSDGVSVRWKDGEGNVIALERDGSIHGRGIEPPASLEITSRLEQRELSLLIATWCAKINMDAVVKAKEPITIDKVRRIMRNSPTQSKFYGAI